MSNAEAGQFQTTSWTLIQAAAHRPTPDSREALERLCQIYWRPVYAFIRRRGYDQDRAQDLSQAFFARLLEKNYVLAADPERGRFRSFLLTAVKNFLANEWDWESAQKRGGGETPASIDLLEAERWYAPAAIETSTPESLFERRWALSLLEQVMAKLRAELVAAGKGAQFEVLLPFLNREAESGRYDDASSELGISAGALRIAVHRLRRRYRDLLRAEIADTVSRPDDADEEIRFLLSVLSR
jgi:RNA polymerase sigma-70 factor (ECF subfamily)